MLSMKKYPKYKDSGISWIGEIPEEWKAIPIYAVAKSFSKGQGITKEQVYVDGDVPCVRYGEIYSKYDNSFDECLSKTKLSELSNPSYFEYGDVLFAGTGELIEEIGKSIVYLGKEKCLAGGDIIILKHNQNPKFMSYCLNSSAVQQQKSYGKTKLKVVHISKDKIKRVVIALPSPSEQHAIVAYLDKKTEQINHFISKAEKEIDRLNELKQAQIAHMVTHGLNPDAPIKDSSIAWIGQIPKHWEVRKIRSHFKERRTKVSDKDYPALSVAREGIVPQLETAVKTDNGDNRKLVLKNDFVVNSRSDRKGSCGVSDYDGSVSLISIVLEPRDIYSKYAHHLFRSNNYIEEFYRNGRGIVADLWTTRYSEMKNIFMPIPPNEEQVSIISAVNNMSEKIDTLTTKLTAQIGYLKELKQRIISDAVTGKIKC